MSGQRQAWRSLYSLWGLETSIRITASSSLCVHHPPLPHRPGQSWNPRTLSKWVPTGPHFSPNTPPPLCPGTPSLVPLALLPQGHPSLDAQSPPPFQLSPGLLAQDTKATQASPSSLPSPTPALQERPGDTINTEVCLYSGPRQPSISPSTVSTLVDFLSPSEGGNTG